jgi:uncharacterized protein (DUF2141 family)
LQAGGSDIDVGSLPSPEFADIDGDGDLDLFAGEYYGSIKVFTNDGSGNFTSAPNLQSGGVDINAGSTPSPVFADINGDGDLDLYVGNYAGNIMVFSNNGSGIFTALPNLQAGGTDIDLGFYATPKFTDIDGDGDLDLYAGEYSGAIKVFTNDGSGNFTASPDLQALENPFLTGFSPTFADIDEDGDPDLYVGNTSGNISVFTNGGSGNFTAAPNLQAGGVDIDAGNYSIPTFADIDDDGDLDLYVGNYAGNIMVFSNNGSGSFVSSANMQAGGSDIDVGNYASPIFADIDGDGDLDLYVGELDGTIKVFSNNGSGIFTASPDLQADGATIDVGYTPTSEFYDIDEDGDLDLIVGEYNGSIKVFTNNGSGIFSASPNLQANGSDINAGLFPKPVFANVDGGCQPDLYLGSLVGYILHYNYSDTTAPQITSTHPDQTVNLGATCEAVLPDYISTIVATDNCSTILNYSQSPVSGIVVSGLTNTVTLTVTDEEGNISNVSFNVSVVDAIDPVIVCPGDVTINLFQGQTFYTVPGTTFDPVSATDNCTVATVINDFNSASTLAGINFPAGTYTIAWTVTDVMGNISSCSFEAVLNLYTGINEVSDLGNNIYPNPTNGFFSIENVRSSNIQITDALGNVIRNFTNVQETKLNIDLSDQPKGIYIITISNDLENGTEKIVLK